MYNEKILKFFKPAYNGNFMSIVYSYNFVNKI